MKWFLGACNWCGGDIYEDAPFGQGCISCRRAASHSELHGRQIDMILRRSPGRLTRPNQPFTGAHR
jgi:hypothetical protein